MKADSSIIEDELEVNVQAGRTIWIDQHSQHVDRGLGSHLCDLSLPETVHSQRIKRRGSVDVTCASQTPISNVGSGRSIRDGP